MVLNISKYRADALLVRDGAITALPLRGISFDHDPLAADIAQAFYTNLTVEGHHAIRARGTRCP